MKAVIVADDPRPGDRSGESRVQIHKADGRPVNTIDYSSADGPHGYGVVKAHWTPDSQISVYSMAFSGGHQPWHSPTYSYGRKINKTRGIRTNSW